jgi:hypothetical protein
MQFHTFSYENYVLLTTSENFILRKRQNTILFRPLHYNGQKILFNQTIFASKSSTNRIESSTQ